MQYKITNALFVLSLFSIVFFSCSSSNNKNDDQTLSEELAAIDSLDNEEEVSEPEASVPKQVKEKDLPPTPTEYNPTIYSKNELIALFQKEKQYSLPLNFDKAFFKSWSPLESKRLNGPAIEMLGSKFQKHTTSQHDQWQYEEAIRMDSFKVTGIYEYYTFHLQIGNTERSDAYVLGLLNLSPTDTMLLWMVDIASVEACPYFDETSVYATRWNGGDSSYCYKLASMQVSADAPYSGSLEHFSSVLQDGIVEMDFTVQSEEPDETDTKNNIWTRKIQYVLELEKDGSLFEVNNDTVKDETIMVTF